MPAQLHHGAEIHAVHGLLCRLLSRHVWIQSNDHQHGLSRPGPVWVAPHNIDFFTDYSLEEWGGVTPAILPKRRVHVPLNKFTLSSRFFKTNSIVLKFYVSTTFSPTCLKFGKKKASYARINNPVVYLLPLLPFSRSFHICWYDHHWITDKSIYICHRVMKLRPWQKWNTCIIKHAECCGYRHGNQCLGH